MVVYDDTSKEPENLDQDEYEPAPLSSMGSILRMVTAGVLGSMLYIMMLTERRFRPDSPRIFSIRAVLIPFIKKLIEDIQDGYMNDVFEEPIINLYRISPFLASVVNAGAYTLTQLYSYRYRVMACLVVGASYYILNKNEDCEERF